jgi:hypothetical protein
LRFRFLRACGLAPASSSFSSQRRITRTGSYAVEDPRDGWYTNSRLAPIDREKKWRIGVKKFNSSSSGAKANEQPMATRIPPSLSHQASSHRSIKYRDCDPVQTARIV